MTLGAIRCQHHNGPFRSLNGGRTCAEIADVQTSAFGFAAAAHPEDPQTAWFAQAVKDECRMPVDIRPVDSRPVAQVVWA